MLISRLLSPSRWLERELKAIETELHPAFVIARPAGGRAPFVFNSPHSGRVYPSAFVSTSRLSAHALRMSEDFFVDQLFEPVTQLGATLMSARFPRAYLDLNRQIFELDPALFAEKLPDYVNSSSLRVIGGLGTIPRIVNEQEEIYSSPIPLSVALARIDRLYRPYHQALRALLEEARACFGCAFLVDCHSMPSQLGEAGGAQGADVVLGDRFGASCSREIVEFVAIHLRAAGYTVAINKPYAGGHITEEYGRPHTQVHALQIEVNRGIYVCERSFELKSGFQVLRSDLQALCAQLIAEFSPRSRHFQAAAE